MTVSVVDGSLRRAPALRSLAEVPIDIALGIDLGSAYTKVAVALPHEGVEPHALTLPHSLTNGIVPTALVVDRDGASSLPTNDDDPADWRFNLKQRFIVSLLRPAPDGDLAAREVAVFVALVMRSAKQEAVRLHDRRISTRPIRWHVNLGVPSRMTDAALVSEFTKLARRAWTMSELDVRIQPEAYLSATTGGPEDHVLGRINAVPEIVAEAAGFSPTIRRQGHLHLLLDVGAATVDLCALSNNTVGGKTTWGNLLGDVQPLGARLLHAERMRAIAVATANHLTSLDRNARRRDNVPDGADMIVPAGLYSASLESVDRAFTDKVMQMCRGLWCDAKKSRVRAELGQGRVVPIAICGGGRSIPVYRQIVGALDAWARKTWRVEAVREVQPQPGNGMDTDLFCRFAVAIGLTRPKAAFDTIRSPAEVPDLVEGPEPDIGSLWYGANYIEK